MSAEMWSGDMAEFEAAAARCPFLSSLGSEALSNIKADLEASQAQVAEALPTPEIAETLRARVAEPQRQSWATQASEDSSVFANRSILPAAAAEIAEQAGFPPAVVVESIAYTTVAHANKVADPPDRRVVRQPIEIIEQISTEVPGEIRHIADLQGHQMFIEPLQTEEVTDPVIVTRAQHAPLAKPKLTAVLKDAQPRVAVEAAIVNVVAEVRTDVTVAPIVPNSSISGETVLAEPEDQNIERVERELPEVPVAAIPQAEFTYEDIEAEVQEPSIGLQTFIKLLATDDVANALHEPTETTEAELPYAELPFSAQLDATVEVEVPLDRRESVLALVARVYELVEQLESVSETSGAAVADAKAADVEVSDEKEHTDMPALEAVIKQVVTEILIELGIDEPDPKQIERFIMLVRSEVNATVAEEITIAEPTDKDSREHLQDFMTSTGYIFHPSAYLMKLLGRLVLAPV